MKAPPCWAATDVHINVPFIKNTCTLLSNTANQLRSKFWLREKKLSLVLSLYFIRSLLDVQCRMKLPQCWIDFNVEKAGYTRDIVELHARMEATIQIWDMRWNSSVIFASRVKIWGSCYWKQGHIFALEFRGAITIERFRQSVVKLVTCVWIIDVTWPLACWTNVYWAHQNSCSISVWSEVKLVWGLRHKIIFSTTVERVFNRFWANSLFSFRISTFI